MASVFSLVHMGTIRYSLCCVRKDIPCLSKSPGRCTLHHRKGGQKGSVPCTSHWESGLLHHCSAQRK